MQKIRVKLYKSGKLWVAAGVAATGMALGLGLTPVSADETPVAEQSATVVPDEVTAPKTTTEATPTEEEGVKSKEDSAKASTESTKAEDKTAKDSTAPEDSKATPVADPADTTPPMTEPGDETTPGPDGTTQPDKNGRDVPTVNTEFNNVVLTKPEDAKNFGSTIKNTAVSKKMDIMFVLDSTGSMVEGIKWVNSGLASFISSLTSAGATDINIGVVTYGDSDPDGDGAKWYSVDLGLGANPIATIKSILSGGYTRYYGGDADEDTVSAIMKTATDTGWRKDSTRWIINATDINSKERATVEYGGQQATYAGMKALLASKGIQLFALQTETPDPEMKSSATKTFRVNNEGEVNSALDSTIKAPVGEAESYTYTVKVTAKYASDGKTSTDVVVTPDKSTITLNAGESGDFNFSTLISNDPARYGDTTIVTIEYFVDGVLIPSKTQKLEYTPEKPELPDTKGPETPKKPGPETPKKPALPATSTPMTNPVVTTTTPTAKATLPQTGEKSNVSLVALGFGIVAGIGGLALYSLKKRLTH